MKEDDVDLKCDMQAYVIFQFKILISKRKIKEIIPEVK
jgi:hypothetical protein